MSAVLPIKSDEIISFNPATGAEIGRVTITSAEDTAAAVARSREAFKQWKQTSFAERKRLVMAAREVILAEVDEIATSSQANQASRLARRSRLRSHPYST